MQHIVKIVHEPQMYHKLKEMLNIIEGMTAEENAIIFCENDASAIHVSSELCLAGVDSACLIKNRVNSDTQRISIGTDKTITDEQASVVINFDANINSYTNVSNKNYNLICQQSLFRYHLHIIYNFAYLENWQTWKRKKSIHIDECQRSQHRRKDDWDSA